LEADDCMVAGQGGRGRRGRRLGREAGGWEEPLAAGCRGEKNRDLNLD
jgi:hypothetical protein